MKRFEYIRAESVSDASGLLIQGNARLMAGGTDLLGALKDKIYPSYPDAVVGLKAIEGLSDIKEEDGKLKIGAMATLSQIASSSLLKKKYPALASAAYSVATPNLRNTATLGGNVCQDTRCWYYRYPDSIGGRINCLRKGGETCYAMTGENRYHSIFGAVKHGITPCSDGCPALTDIPGYMSRLRQGDWDGAAQIIMLANPMPMITSRICPHPCQDKCNQCEYGESVAINCVERSLGDYILKNADKFYAAPRHETNKRISVIGAGPGGLTFAYYMRKEGHSVTVYDRMEKPGGVLRYGIPHYRLPKTIVDSFTDALTNMGIEFKMGVNVGKDISVEEINANSDGIYFGTGAWKQPILGLAGESLTQFGLNFLVEVNTYLQKAIGNNVLVCGGGSVAMDVALTAVRLGAGNVKLACLEQRHEMPATAEEVSMAEEEGVKIYNGRGLGGIITDADGKITGLEAVKCLTVLDEEGRFRPTYDENDRIVIDADYIILATGQRVDIDFLGEKFGGQLKSQRGLIEVENMETYRTKLPSVYAGGDAVTGPNIAIRAIRAGNLAARGMGRELGFPAIAAGVGNARFLDFDAEAIKRTNGARQKKRPIEERVLTDEDSESLTERQAADEAYRCMNCGCLAVNPSDMAPVLMALEATAVTNMRSIPAETLFSKTNVSDSLQDGEIILGFELQCVDDDVTARYDKFRLRGSIDFSIVGLATSYTVKGGRITDARIVLGACAPIPLRAPEAEKYVIGKTPCDETAQMAADIALTGVLPLEKNAYKAAIAKTLVKRSIERLICQ
ncbi:MAG: FAD binding domain-containing protein [Synergistaceae bacterium]|jgi:NADPH-dependent glutamate synthase beta subunit-like oxidoreductase|nr:FAD binding domain-containing protein [Synergistaceae bacterium]